MSRPAGPTSSRAAPSAGGKAAPPLVCCAICGTESQQPVFRPLPIEQPPDLDLRPGERLRGTMSRWLQVCPECAYAAPDISRAHPSAAEAVHAAPFRALIAETTHPPLARRFLAWAYVLEETGALHAAAEATLQAAWVADDAMMPDLATQWRLDAVALWRAGPPLDVEQELRVVDALRRAGEWDAAVSTAEATLARHPPDMIGPALMLERRLANARDAGRYSMGSAMPPPSHRPHVSHQKLQAGRGFGDGLMGRFVNWAAKLFRRE
ncbi:hypothetical protein IAI18_17905 [Acetobacteraceae bacterium H6797]|nr:hypothetical protein [Acetobacteraceae bacterium H6797]